MVVDVGEDMVLVLFLSGVVLIIFVGLNAYSPLYMPLLAVAYAFLFGFF